MSDFTESDEQVWILGIPYTPNPPKRREASSNHSSEHHHNHQQQQQQQQQLEMTASPPASPRTPSNSISDKIWRLATGANNNQQSSSTSSNQPASLEDNELEFYYTVQRETLMCDFYTRIWCTYRKDFAPIVTYKPSVLAKMFTRCQNPFMSVVQQHYQQHQQHQQQYQHQHITANNKSSNVVTSSSYQDLSPSSQLVVTGDIYSTSDPGSSPSLYYTNSPQSEQTKSSTMTKLYQSLSCYTSDTGWGCMMRSGQMLLAQAYLHYYCGRSFRIRQQHQRAHSYPLQLQLESEDLYRTILGWFADEEPAPYSIHRVALAGTLFGKKIGEWYGPTDMSNVLKKLVDCHQGDRFAVHIAEQGGIYVDEIIQMCTDQTELIIHKQAAELREKLNMRADDWVQVNTRDTEPSAPSYPITTTTGHGDALNIVDHSGGTQQTLVNEHQDQEAKDDNFWRPVVILVPLRLGLDCLNPIYEQSLREVLEIPQSLGIMGGKPRSSLYFIGYQGDHFVYLDPHTVQKKSTSVSTYHCKTPMKLKMSDIDPSLAIGFLCADRNNFDEFIEHAKRLSKVKNPIWSVSHSRPNLYSARTRSQPPQKPTTATPPSETPAPTITITTTATPGTRMHQVPSPPTRYPLETQFDLDKSDSDDDDDDGFECISMEDEFDLCDSEHSDCPDTTSRRAGY